MEHSLVERMLERAVQIQQIPAPTFAELERAKFILEKFEAEVERLSATGVLAQAWMDEIGNVFFDLTGSSSKPPLVVSAHSDTVFPLSTDLSLQRGLGTLRGAGIGDNALGVAGLFGLLWMLESANWLKHLPIDVCLVANVGEEGLGDLCGMQRVIDRFGKQVSAYLVLEGMALGQVYHHGLGVERYRITVRTRGGHSWVDHGMPSAIHELAALITRLVAIQLPKRPRTTLNVGLVSGGTSVNTIAAEAHCEIDLRSDSRQGLSNLVYQVHNLVRQAQADLQARAEKLWRAEQAEKRHLYEYEIELIGKRPSGRLPLSHPLVQLARKSLEAQGIRPQFHSGSTDANLPLSLGLPAICIGLSKGCGAHTLEETLQTKPLEQGLAQLLMLVEAIFAEQNR